jgi:NTP pyrophosphatase (non-canonical NTP hydrolase)
MTLRDLMLLQKKFDQDHGRRTKFYVKITDKNIRELEHLLVCLMGEVGEISNLAKKMVRGDKTVSLSRPAVKGRVAEEVTDVFIYLLKMCNQMGIDLEAEYLKKLRLNQKRFRKFKR